MFFSQTDVQFLVTLIIFLFSIFLNFLISNFFGISKYRVFLIYIWHSLFIFAYIFFLKQNGGDSIAYYEAALSGTVEFNFGTAAVQYLVLLLVKFFDVSFLGAFFVFSYIGFLGLLFMDSALNHIESPKNNMVSSLKFLIVFFPSISFWSVAIGKDSIAFLACCLCLWSYLNISSRFAGLFLSIILMLFVRPHIGAIMSLTLALAVLISSSTSKFAKFFIFLVISMMSVPLATVALKFVGLSADDLNSNSLNNYIETRQSYNMSGGGSVDISSMNIFQQLYTYLFRPAFYEINSFLSLFAALENLFLFVFFIYILIFIYKNGIKKHRNYLFFILYFLACWIVLATTTANLGIALRQKWMFTPMLLFVFFYFQSLSNPRLVFRKP